MNWQFCSKAVPLTKGGGRHYCSRPSHCQHMHHSKTELHQVDLWLLIYWLSVRKITVEHNCEQRWCSYGPFQSAEHRMLELKKTMQSLYSQPPYPLTEQANSQYHPEMLTNEILCLVCQQTHVISRNGMMSILKQLKNAKTAASKPHEHNVLLRSMLLLKIKTWKHSNSPKFCFPTPCTLTIPHETHELNQ